MCFILPVDHIPCTHTIAIWQHCAHAPRSKTHGLKPCSRIRSHSRPILTRKLCINCGGPKVLNRRGGVTEREGNSADAIEEKENEHKENDSGYHSDAIIEEEGEGEEDVESAVSPRAQRRRGSSREDYEARLVKRAMRTHRSPHKHTSWKPNLRSQLRESSSSSGSSRRLSIDSQASSLTDGSVRYSQWPDVDCTPRSVPSNLDSITAGKKPVLQPLDTGSTPYRRKSSTLQHPSSPPDETSRYDDHSLYSNDNDLEDSPLGKLSTLLHPSTPSTNTTPIQDPISAFCFPEITLTQPSLLQPRRKSSTLLHPSSPPDSLELSFLLSTTSNLNPFPSPLPTPPSSANSLDAGTTSFNLIPAPAKKKGSVIHSSLSDLDPESDSDDRSSYSESDYGDRKSYMSESEIFNDYNDSSVDKFDYDSDDTKTIAAADEYSSRNSTLLIEATTVRMGRASRIELHNANWRASP